MSIVPDAFMVFERFWSIPKIGVWGEMELAWIRYSECGWYGCYLVNQKPINESGQFSWMEHPHYCHPISSLAHLAPSTKVCQRVGPCDVAVRLSLGSSCVCHEPIMFVYAYGWKTVRAFCFFFEYCSLSWGWGGVGWGGMLTFLVLRTGYIAMLLRSLGSLTTWHVATLLRSLVWVGVGVGWGGGAC